MTLRGKKYIQGHENRLRTAQKQFNTFISDI